MSPSTSGSQLSSVLQRFRHGDMFWPDLCAGHWTARWRSHDAMHARPAERQRTVLMSRQKNAQEYFKRTCFMPFIETCRSTAQLDEHSTRQAANVCQLSALLPALLNCSNYEDIESAAKLRSHFCRTVSRRAGPTKHYREETRLR